MSEDQVNSEAIAKFPSPQSGSLSESHDYVGELIY